MPRPYKTPGGILTSSVALILAIAAVIAGFVVNPKAWFIAATIYAVFIAYFLLYSRYHLIKGTPEEEFANIKSAEQRLKEEG
jgi:ethanolamine permease